MKKNKLTELGPELIWPTISNIVERAMFYHLEGRGESGLIDTRIKPLVDITIVGSKNETLMFNAIKEWAEKWSQLKKIITPDTTPAQQPKPPQLLISAAKLLILAPAMQKFSSTTQMDEQTTARSFSPPQVLIKPCKMTVNVTHLVT